MISHFGLFCNTFFASLKEYLEIVKKSAQLIRNLLQEKIIFLRFDPPLAYENDENLAATDSDKAEFIKLGIAFKTLSLKISKSFRYSQK